MDEEKILGWHFCDGWKLRDGTPLEIGRTYTVDGPTKLCERGLHSSIRLLDALRYAPGSFVCRVESWGDIKSESNKLVSLNRTVVAVADATICLHNCACDVAEAALLIADITDQRCWDALEAKRAWLRGEISDDDLNAARDAARDAAWAAARDAARDAAWAAAWDAAWDAARNAARDAARDAAWAAAWGAAWGAARDAAWDEINSVFEKSFLELLQCK